MGGNIIDNRNIIVGAGAIYMKPNPAVSAVAAAGGTANTTILNPTTDADKFRLGDVVQIGANAEKVQLHAIDPETGTLTHDPVTTPADAAATVKLEWINLGATDGGIELAGQTSLTDHRVDQSDYPVATTIDSREASIKAPLAEMTLPNLALALGMPQTSIGLEGGVEILGVGSTAGIREDVFLMTGAAPKGKKRTVRLHRGVNKGALSYKLARDGKAIINLDLSGLWDSTQPKGQEIFTILDSSTGYQF